MLAKSKYTKPDLDASRTHCKPYFQVFQYSHFETFAVSATTHARQKCTSFKKIVSGITFALLGIFLTPLAVSLVVQADRMESNSYVIQFGNFNITSGRKDSPSYSLTDTVGQSVAGPFGAYGSSDYFVGAGFQYIYQIGRFEFIISDLNIPLGLLSSGVHSTGSNTLTISTRGAGGFTVYGYQINPLRHTNGIDIIPGTTCDNGTCTTTTSSPWISQSIPGFGFNAEGNTAAADFINNTYFRPFANQEANEPMQVIMSSPNIANNESVTVTYKAGISGDQAAGEYQTSVVYVAVPGY